eukprot:207871-Pyramimonas_sp.AAC.1
MLEAAWTGDPVALRRALEEILEDIFARISDEDEPEGEGEEGVRRGAESESECEELVRRSEEMKEVQSRRELVASLPVDKV